MLRSGCSDSREINPPKSQLRYCPRRHASSTILADASSGTLAAPDCWHCLGLQRAFSRPARGGGRIHQCARTEESNPSSHAGHRAHFPRGHCARVRGRGVFCGTRREHELDDCATLCSRRSDGHAGRGKIHRPLLGYGIAKRLCLSCGGRGNGHGGEGHSSCNRDQRLKRTPDKTRFISQSLIKMTF